MPVLENIEDFQKFDQPSRRFMQFEERLLTDNKADQSHWSTVSFNNMKLRVPCTLKSSYIEIDGGKIIHIPYDARVRIESFLHKGYDFMRILLSCGRYDNQFCNVTIH